MTVTINLAEIDQQQGANWLADRVGKGPSRPAGLAIAPVITPRDVHLSRASLAAVRHAVRSALAAQPTNGDASRTTARPPSLQRNLPSGKGEHPYTPVQEANLGPYVRDAFGRFAPDTGGGTGGGAGDSGRSGKERFTPKAGGSMAGALDEILADPNTQELFGRENDPRAGNRVTIAQHTANMMKHLEDQLDADPAPVAALAERTGLNVRHALELGAALHDIGKPLAHDAHSGRRQHEFTEPLFRDTLANHGLSPAEIDLAWAIYGHDQIGSAVRGHVEPSDAAEALRYRAESIAHVPAELLAPIYRAVYLADVAAYPRMKAKFITDHPDGSLSMEKHWDNDRLLAILGALGLLQEANMGPYVRDAQGRFAPDTGSGGSGTGGLNPASSTAHGPQGRFAEIGSPTTWFRGSGDPDVARSSRGSAVWFAASERVAGKFTNRHDPNSQVRQYRLKFPADKVFDPTRPDHLQALADSSEAHHLFKKDEQGNVMIVPFAAWAGMGWAVHSMNPSAIEDRRIIGAIETLGFKATLETEDGELSLMVFDGEDVELVKPSTSISEANMGPYVRDEKGRFASGDGSGTATSVAGSSMKPTSQAGSLDSINVGATTAAIFDAIKRRRVEQFGESPTLKVDREMSPEDVLSSSPLRGGVNETEIVEYLNSNGDRVKGLFKLQSGESDAVKPAYTGRQTVNEVLAFVVDQEMGLGLNGEVQAVRIAGKGQGTLHEWINDDAIMAGFALNNGPLSSDTPPTDLPGFADMVWYDALIGNSDRHMQNWLIKDGRVRTIDNGMSMARQADYDADDETRLRYRSVEWWGKMVGGRLAQERSIEVRVSDQFLAGLESIFARRTEVTQRLIENGLDGERLDDFWDRARVLSELGWNEGSLQANTKLHQDIGKLVSLLRRHGKIRP